MSNHPDMQLLGERIEENSVFIDDINRELDKVIVGQRYMIDRLLIGLLAEGHVLLEGVPGLAKTLTVSSLATVISTDFQRDRQSTRLNSSHVASSYAVFCL